MSPKKESSEAKTFQSDGTSNNTYCILFVQTEVAPRKIFYSNCMKEHVNSDSSVPHLELDITDIHTLREKYDIVKLAS